MKEEGICSFCVCERWFGCIIQLVVRQIESE